MPKGGLSEGQDIVRELIGRSTDFVCRDQLTPPSDEQFNLQPLQSSRLLEREKFRRTILGRESATALPLLVFPTGHFSRPQERYEERIFRSDCCAAAHQDERNAKMSQATRVRILKLVMCCVLSLLGNIAYASSVNSYTLNGVKWSLSADMVAGTTYNNPDNRPSTTSVVFPSTDPHGGPTIYYNMTITGFKYTSTNHGTDIAVPKAIEWDSYGSAGVRSGRVQYITSGAFENTDVTTVEIPYTILGVNLPCFRNCRDLTAIRVTNGS